MQKPGIVHPGDRRGQSAVVVLLGVVVVAAVGWYVASLWQENAYLRQRVVQKPGSPAGESAPAAGAPAPVAGGRALDEDHAKAMRQVLEGFTGSPKRAWIQLQAGDREAGAFANQLAQVFKDGGWTVVVSTISGMTIKPGLFFFEADESSPEFVGTALEALKAGGLDPVAATGYRAFYEEKKKENPKWVGIQLEPSQAFALVVGPKPPQS